MMTVSAEAPDEDILTVYPEEASRCNLAEVLIVLGLIVGSGIGGIFSMWLGWLLAPTVGFIVGGVLGVALYIHHRCTGKKT